jgi:hypothetical protein
LGKITRSRAHVNRSITSWNNRRSWCYGSK